jgi:metallo-beta-lactamase class B
MKIAFAASLLAAVALASPALAVPTAWTQPLAPFRVIDNVYYVGSAGISAWIIKTPTGLILLDAGMPEYAATVEANILTLGFKLSDVKILLNSHAHFDHSGGLARIKADTGGRLIASAGDRLALERGIYPGWEQDHSFDAPPVKVDRIVADGGTVALGGVKLTAMITPGHSAGCTNYLMTVRDQGAPHTAFFFCSASVAANRLVPDSQNLGPQYPGIVADYRRTFARLKTVKTDVFLAPHAEFFDLAEKRARLGKAGPNPFIVPGEMQKLVADMEAGFVKSLAEQTSRARTAKP